MQHRGRRSSNGGRRVCSLPSSRCLALTASTICTVSLCASTSAFATGVPYVAEGERPPVAKPWTPCPPATKGHPECELIVAPRPSEDAAVAYEGSGPEGGLKPAELRAAYKLPEHGGRGVTVAVVDGSHDPHAEKDLNEYRKYFEIPECKKSECFEQVNEHGEPSEPTSATEYALEISLDLDMVSAACPECHIILVEAETEPGILEAQATAIKLGASVISNSWNFGFEAENPANKAACEERKGFCVSKEEEEKDDPYFDHPGTAILFAGGDYGYAVRYPAVSQYVVSVGGTELKKAENARGWTEKVWFNPTEYPNVDEKGRGTGSGCSVHEPEPEWEKVSSNAACKHRMQNDVAADADWATSPVALYDSYYGGWSNNGGTSASSPFVAGVEGLSASSARELGAKAMWLAGEAGTLFDVTEEINGTCTPPEEDAYWCSAEVGYDGPTGWGTADGIVAVPPAVTTVSATRVKEKEATVHGTVNPEGAETRYLFRIWSHKGIRVEDGGSERRLWYEQRRSQPDHHRPNRWCRLRLPACGNEPRGNDVRIQHGIYCRRTAILPDGIENIAHHI
jgi:subtilase family serine protease